MSFPSQATRRSRINAITMLLSVGSSFIFIALSGCGSKSPEATASPGATTTSSTPAAPPQPGQSSVNPDQIMKEIKDDKNPGVGINSGAGGK